MQQRKRMSKGIFWFPCFVGAEGELIFTDRIEARITSETAAPNTHKDSWKAVTAGRKDLRGIPWNYFPRGRVEISRGWALVFMNPQILNCENYLERIREKFEIGHLDIRVRIDNSAHYQCTILEDVENGSESLSYLRKGKERRGSVGQRGHKTKDRKAFGSKRKYK